jgi:uncharacterized protein YjbI with pentapeptide repeats
MANPLHVEILKQGVELWNAWRRTSLAKPDLSGAELGGANLLAADLTRADLTGADLTRANLTRAALVEANLSGATLIESLLSDADFLRADLTDANLMGAILRGAILVNTKLRGADFANCVMGLTVLVDLNLGEAKGLESVTHHSPSNIGIDTIYVSSGNIPEVFLRGCGVPEEFIAYVRSLEAHHIKFYSCFISYSSKDRLFAERLHADLQNKGVRCWFAPVDMKTGDVISARIDESISYYDKVLLVLSEHSVSSWWVKKEVETAMEREAEQGRAILFPVRLDDAVMGIKTDWPADVRRTRHIGDFTRWEDGNSYQKAFDRLLRDLKAEGQGEQRKGVR